MITRHHLALAGLGTAILVAAFGISDPVQFLLVILGSSLGAVLPDFHMKKPRTAKMRMPAWYIAQFSARFCVPVIFWVYHSLFGKTVDPRDKKMTHTIPGILLLFGIIAVLSLVPFLIFRLPGITAFLSGLFFGLTLHLLTDLCCKKPLSPFHPFSNVCVSGSIRPCDRSDPRVLRFILCNGAVFIFVMIIRYAGTGDFPVPVMGLTSFILCQGVMIAQSDVTVSPDCRKPANFPAANG